MGMDFPMMASHDSSAEVLDFSLPASTGQTLSLDSFKGKVPLVIIFLDLSREDDRELLEILNVRHKDFGSERSQLLVAVRLTAREVREVADDMDLSLPLLADASGAMARGYDVGVGEGRQVAIVADKDGRIVRSFDPLSEEGDPSEVTDALLETVRGIGTEHRT